MAGMAAAIPIYNNVHLAKAPFTFSSAAMNNMQKLSQAMF